MKNTRNISSPDNEVNTARKDELVGGSNCCQIFARFVLDIFDNQIIMFDGIHWMGKERSTGQPAYYLEGKALERQLKRYTGLENTLELRKRLLENGILLQRKDKSSIVQERVPPAGTIKEKEKEQLKNGKASVWVLDQAAVRSALYGTQITTEEQSGEVSTKDIDKKDQVEDAVKDNEDTGNMEMPSNNAEKRDSSMIIECVREPSPAQAEIGFVQTVS